MSINEFNEFKMVMTDSELINELGDDFNIDFINSSAFLEKEYNRAVKLVLYRENTYETLADTQYFRSKLIEGLYLLHSTRFEAYGDWGHTNEYRICIDKYDPTIQKAFNVTRVYLRDSMRFDDDMLINIPRFPVPSAKYTQEEYDTKRIKYMYNLKTVDIDCEIPWGNPKKWSLSQLVFCVNATRVNISSTYWVEYVSFDFTNLSKLKKLQTLTLCNIRNIDYDFLNTLTNLTTLEIQTRFESEQSIDLRKLNRLTNLKKLSIIGIKIDDPSVLSEFTNLTDLQLCHTSISDLSPITMLDKLTKLFLYGPEVVDLSPLSGMIGLVLLQLQKTDVSDLSPLSNLINLKALDLFENRNVKSVSHVIDLPNLKAICLHECTIEDGSVFTEFSYFKFMFNCHKIISPKIRGDFVVKYNNQYIILSRILKIK
jgi:hypothetical protein